MKSKRIVLSTIWAAVFTAAYFSLLDGVRPALEERRAVWLWWLILGVFLVLLFMFACLPDALRRPKFFAFGFILLAAAIYCYDPTINSYLGAHGLGRLWVVPLALFFIWLSTLSIPHRGHSDRTH